MPEALTKAQKRMLADLGLRDRFGDGLTMYDGVEARVASNLAAKGLATLPVGHGSFFGSPFLKVRITAAGRRTLQEPQDAE